MSDMPIFQPQPMFQDANPTPDPQPKRNSRKGTDGRLHVNRRAKAQRAQQPDPAVEPKGPKKPRTKPMRRKRAVTSTAENEASGRLTKDIYKLIGALIELSDADRALVLKITKAALK